VAGLDEVSIVIATRDRPGVLRETLRSIGEGDRLPAEVIVADQSARASELPSLGEEVSVRHLRLPAEGVSRARNTAIAAATKPILVFTDDDVLVERDWLRLLVEALRRAPSRTAVTGRVLAAEADGHVPSVTHWQEREVFAGRLFADVLFQNNMAIHREAFDEVGAFDERFGPGSAFPSAEDNDLGYRLLEAGYTIEFVPEAVVHHRGARRGRELVMLQWAYGRGQGAFYAKHMRRADLHMLRRLGRNAVFRLRRMAGIVRGERAALREGVYLAGLFWGVLSWWARARRG
jgi:GT2 family glycosyltransferase